MMKRYLKTLVILLLIFVIEYITGEVWLKSKKDALRQKHANELTKIPLKHEIDKKALDDEFQKRKYLATGTDAYQRIYNTTNQNITELITRLAEESFPDDWRCEVKVDEFTNFLLMVQTTVNDSENFKNTEYELNKLYKYIAPALTYTSNVLKNICVFDSKHRCYLFFDENALNELWTTKTLSQATRLDIINTGKHFTRYNSIKIDCNQQYGHIYVPVVVAGENGIYECMMMLDTGASMTIISLELAQKTGYEDLNRSRRQTFSTANGLLSCPIVTRSIIAGGIGGIQSVAVNLNDNDNLLGVDFFENRNYVIDASSGCIYVWEKTKLNKN